MTKTGKCFGAVRGFLTGLFAIALVAALPGCSLFGGADGPMLESVSPEKAEYHIGPLDTLQIFVWRNPDLSTSVPVRPDGRISVPLIEDLEVAGKTPTALARDIEKKLAVFIQDPIVTVIVSSFVGPFRDQIRVIGEATRPQSLPYRANMSLLDLMIAVGGITDFAAGNRAAIYRVVDGDTKRYRVRIDDLLRDGDITANVGLQPGDVLVIPEAWF